MTVGFTGSRDFEPKTLVWEFVEKLARKHPDTTAVSGGRGNVDTTAEEAGIHFGLEVISYRPTEVGVDVAHYEPGKGWSVNPMLGVSGGWVRNAFFRNGLIAGSERVVAFWDGWSRGTADTIQKALNKGRPTFVYTPEGELVERDEVDERLREVLS